MSDVPPRIFPLVHENQKVVVDEIYKNFHYTPTRYGILRAQVQSGKTGVYQHLISKMFKRGKIDRAYIVSGSNETELRDQCKKDVEEYHGDKAYCDHIQVIFRQDFKKISMNTDRCLIIVDESHLVQDAEQTFYGFMRKHSLTMAGTNLGMVMKDTYILSVSATPTAEEAALAYDLSLPKFIVEHKPGDGYYGPDNYRCDGLIREALDLTTSSGATEFSSLLRSFPNKYVLVRVQSRSHQLNAIKGCAIETGCDVVYFDSKRAKGKAQVVITDAETATHFRNYGYTVVSLESAPSKTTIVFIDGRLRCGKRVPKKHVGFIWETSKAAGTDTIVQSLFGRMCGYKGDGVYDVPLDEKPLIFVPGYLLERQKPNKIVELSDLERYCKRSKSGEVGVTPRFAKNIDPCRIQSKPMRGDHEVYQCAPIMFRLTEDDIARLNDLKVKGTGEGTLSNLCLKRFVENRHLIEENCDLTVRQRSQILKKVFSGRDCDTSVRRYLGGSNSHMYGCHMDAHLDRCASKEHITHFPFLTFCIVCDEDSAPDGYTDPKYDAYKVRGTVFAIFYTKQSGKFDVIPKESRVSHVNDKTHFTIRADDVLIDCPVGGVYGLTPLILTSVEKLHSGLNAIIKCQRESIDSGVIFSKRITDLFGEAIKLPCAVYGPNLEVLYTIKAVLERKWSTRITIKTAERRPIDAAAGAGEGAPTHRTILSISWE